MAGATRVIQREWKKGQFINSGLWSAGSAFVADLNAIVADLGTLAALTPLSGSATYDPPSLADGVGTTTTLTVTGAALGDFARCSFSVDLAGITVTCYVSSANTVSVRFQNESGGTLDLASGTLRAQVFPAASSTAPTITGFLITELDDA